jgi:hypothetical protein
MEVRKMDTKAINDRGPQTRYTVYDSEGIELGQMTLAEASAEYGQSAHIELNDQNYATITVDR